MYALLNTGDMDVEAEDFRRERAPVGELLRTLDAALPG